MKRISFEAEQLLLTYDSGARNHLHRPCTAAPPRHQQDRQTPRASADPSPKTYFSLSDEHSTDFELVLHLHPEHVVLVQGPEHEASGGPCPHNAHHHPYLEESKVWQLF